MDSIIITSDKYDQLVPREMFPERLDSAFCLYSCVQIKDQEGVLFYNVNPEAWNLLYPYYDTHFKFTMDYFVVPDHEITFQELIVEYEKRYYSIYESQRGYDIEKRKRIIGHGFQELYHLHEIEIIDSNEVVYELKYSKTAKVWTLYRLENYILRYVDDPSRLLKQEAYPQSLVTFQNPTISDGIKVVGNAVYLLSNPIFVSRLKKFKIIIN